MFLIFETLLLMLDTVMNFLFKLSLSSNTYMRIITIILRRWRVYLFLVLALLDPFPDLLIGPFPMNYAEYIDHLVNNFEDDSVISNS